MGDIVASVLGRGLAAGAIAAPAMALILWAAWLMARHWRPSQWRGGRSGFPVITVALTLLIFTLPAGCVWALRPQPQPKSIRIVQALEIPLRNAVDRDDLIAIFRHVGDMEGLAFSDTTESWRRAPAGSRKTLYLALDRPVGPRREWEMTATDDGDGTDPWITFYAGVDADRAAQARSEMLAELRARFPTALNVPVLRSGGLPLRRDLERKGHAYHILEERAASYGATIEP